MITFQQIKTWFQYYYHNSQLIYLPLRITLAIIMAINGMAVVIGVLALKWMWDHPGNIHTVPLIFFTFISWATAICATKLWSFKKWAFWGLCIASVANTIFLLVTKSTVKVALASLVVPLVVFLCLQIGGKRKGWLRMAKQPRPLP